MLRHYKITTNPNIQFHVLYLEVNTVLPILIQIITYFNKIRSITLRAVKEWENMLPVFVHFIVLLFLILEFM